MASSTRSIVSYDDITLPPPPQPRSNSPNPPPTKKRKWSNKKSKGRNTQPYNNFQRTTSNNAEYAPGSSSTAMDVEAENADEDEEGRDLTHHEIWDDSALIDAWNAATEEYEAYNGPEKGWKAEPVHKSPLWYNTPKTKEKPSTSTTSNGRVAVPAVPGSTEDAAPIPGPEDISQLPSELGPMVSQDEAFSRAMGAMYWSGYWTAVYHYQRRLDQQRALGAAQKGEEEYYEDEEYAEDEDGEEGEEDEAFVSTQR
ncbi:hypothetical protein LshimejAT787_0309600 [Lyophyllum shimeji]|uniref:Survival Motor Neuron Gemin2-binding domain-containing protein n=1 Tax=Lyophyllum shimeji TaxID=47721 RepID=A0A9P3PIP0_LYOSH|nr:hypothetical protein LshimejAT787_0309600 [Lyophyllum shimeji]